MSVRDRKGCWNRAVKYSGKTLTVDPYVCIDVAHREKTAPLGFCESIFLIKDAISLCQPACVQLMQVILCCLTEGLFACSVLGQPPRAHSLHRQKLCSDQMCFTDKELEMEEGMNEGRNLPLQLQF